MDMELAVIQMVQDFEELAEQYESAASNERLWAKGAEDSETAQMHEENAEHDMEMAEMYRKMAKYPVALLKLFEERSINAG
jgi:uncharacterized coiled-coil DUF342 family protein